MLRNSQIVPSCSVRHFLCHEPSCAWLAGKLQGFDHVHSNLTAVQERHMREEEGAQLRQVGQQID